MPNFTVPLTHHYHKTLLTISMLMSVSVCHAALPSTISQALTDANLDASNISMVIIPLNQGEQSNHLPAAVVAKKSPKSDALSSNSAQSDTLATNPLETDEVTGNTNASAEAIDISKLDPAAIKPVMIDKPKHKPIALDDGSTIQPIFRDSEPLIADNNAKKATDSKPKTYKPLEKPIYHLANQPRTPASTMKLIPTFVALDTLGKDFVWQTQIFHTGVIINNTLYGDMIIKGSGDPKLTHERLTQLLYQAKKAGITHIDGDIILDTSIFQHVGKDPAAFDNEPLRPYNASPDGLLINFNSIEISALADDTGKSSLTYKPILADYHLPTSLNQRPASCGSIKYSLAPKWQANTLSFDKDIPSGCGSQKFYIAYPSATDFARRVVKQKWQELGNTLNGQVITRSELTPKLTKSGVDTLNSLPATTAQQQKTPQVVGLKAWKNPIALASYPSLPLSAQIYDINHYSNNVMTEQLTLSLPIYSANNHHATKTYSNYPSALTNIRQWWQTHLTTVPPIMSNGSGLCRDCSVTANNLAELLQHAYQHPSFDTYVQSLGVAGVSGTIAAHADRLPNSQAIGRAWIKTGTLDNVTSMAGYVKGQSGQDYVVVGIINTEHTLNTAQARPVLDTMLDWTAQH